MAEELAGRPASELDAAWLPLMSRTQAAEARLDSARQQAAGRLERVRGSRPTEYVTVPFDQPFELAEYAVREREARVARAEAALAMALEDEAPFRAEWDRRGGWSRGWLCLASGGHVHRATWCSTTFATTAFSLVSAVSGLSDEEVVAKIGCKACTVCYPEAPVHPEFKRTQAEVEAAAAAKAASMCPGSGRVAAAGRYRYAPCPVCGRSQSVTPSGLVRSHKAPKAKGGAS